MKKSVDKLDLDGLRLRSWPWKAMRTAKKDPAPQGGTSTRCVSTGVFLSGFLLSTADRTLRVSSAPKWVAGEKT